MCFENVLTLIEIVLATLILLMKYSNCKLLTFSPLLSYKYGCIAFHRETGKRTHRIKRDTFFRLTRHGSFSVRVSARASLIS